MFVSRVDREKYPDVTQEFRFELQGPEAERQRKESAEAPQTDCETAEAPKTNREAARESQPEQKNRKAENQEQGLELEPSAGEFALDPMVLEFLDADNYEQRLNILAGIHHRITDDMITTMAIACDVEINEGDTEERYEALKTCLLTLEKYECNRLR